VDRTVISSIVLSGAGHGELVRLDGTDKVGASGASVGGPAVVVVGVPLEQALARARVCIKGVVVVEGRSIGPGPGGACWCSAHPVSE